MPEYKTLSLFEAPIDFYAQGGVAVAWIILRRVRGDEADGRISIRFFFGTTMNEGRRPIAVRWRRNPAKILIPIRKDWNEDLIDQAEETEEEVLCCRRNKMKI